MIKHSLLAVIMAMSAGVVLGQDSLQLVFQTFDGTIKTIDANSLSISLSGDKLIAVNGTSSLELELLQLEKMYFSSGASGIELMPVSFYDSEVSVYSLDGVFVGKYSSYIQASSSLTAGVYIMRTSDNKTFKIAVQ